jgi:hypothetical protein
MADKDEVPGSSPGRPTTQHVTSGMLVIFTFEGGSAGRAPDEDLIPWLPVPSHGQGRPGPLIRSFERHLRAENRSERSIATYSLACAWPTPSCAPEAPP